MTQPIRSPLTAMSGCVTALPTPFIRDTIDEAAFTSFCDWQIEQGVRALVVNGTTGEAPALSMAEQARLVALAVRISRGRVPIIAGAGSNATAHAVDLAKQAVANGADGLLAVTPYYNRPSQEGLFEHFEALHAATDLPIFLYDVPARTGSTLTLETILRLAELPRIIGLKDATGDLARLPRLRKQLGDEFRLLSGDDATVLDFLALGGNGCVSVVSNIDPMMCVWLHEAWGRGETSEARAIARTLAPLAHALFLESNPVPVKYALGLMGRMRADMRLPLTQPSAETRAAVTEALSRLGHLAEIQNPVTHMASARGR
jgi:4-hydroxy-tetrahydrodipicolinate synthase